MPGPAFNRRRGLFIARPDHRRRQWRLTGGEVFPTIYPVEQARFLGIDLGRRRVGLALSDPSGLIARPLETITVTGYGDALDKILAAARENKVDGIVLGWPISMSGRPSESTLEVEAFADKLRASCAVPVYLEDERLSSHQALTILHAHGKKIKGNKDKLDRISAAIILQSFLDRRQMNIARDA